MAEPFAARLAELQKKATRAPWQFTVRNDLDAPASIALEEGIGRQRALAMSPRYGLDRFKDDAALVLFLRNHTEAILALVEAGDELDAAWSDAIDAMDDDNIIPTPLYDRWMAAHREFRLKWEALNG